MPPFFENYLAQDNRNEVIDETYGAYGPRDNLRFGPRDVAASEHAEKHPLQANLENWHSIDATLSEIRAEQLFGAHMAFRLRQERLIAEGIAKNRQTLGLSSNILSREILANSDESIDAPDFKFHF
ncbi:hypothetical protein DI09_48p180 [Mitosporidium daphniae]|uniref:Uncharacterized protein n=1 Tax=Mitosporidium daphniae TaxID=1485682 RepID=A0A098VPM6_9MICR|nr:uncharacterized protein DI09_48p180 [Mitosporidium daphniae]KGG51012.1 hypothetical protein DI09_48p180 [Mitosporidium daphniae]|eukprot:XP_013237439.1 uncharacterized protein DI09_48p180 [Mitosporidium daphniae]